MLALTCLGWARDRQAETPERRKLASALHDLPPGPGLVRVNCRRKIRWLAPSNVPSLRRELQECGAEPDTLPPFRAEEMADLRVNTNGRVSLRPLPARVAVALGRPLSLERLSAGDLTVVPGVGPRLSDRILAWVEASIELGEPVDPCRIEEVRGVGPVLAYRIRRLLLAGRRCPGS